MRILITNDDGINAPGLTTLTAIAHEVAGKDGEVWTVAPAFEQSGVGHCISYANPSMISQIEDRKYMIEGSPADCVLASLYDVMKDSKPDLVLSGVNRGNNAADNTLYSGTIGAVMEAALQGVPGIALSQFFGVGNRDLDDPFEPALVHGAATVRALLDKGMKVVSQGFRKQTNFGMEASISPNGRRYLWITGGRQDQPTGAGTDVTANLDGYISVTPMRADLTAHDMLADLSDRLK
jgi:5'-nucleotidase